MVSIDKTITIIDELSKTAERPLERGLVIIFLQANLKII
jgi:hypothetical protein